MEALKNAVTVISVSMIFYGVISLVVPFEGMNKSFKFVAAISLLAAVTVALKGVKLSNIFDEIKVDMTEQTANGFENTVLEAELNSVEKAVENLINSRLRSAGEKNAICKVTADISEDNSIIITDVEIFCNKDSVEKIKNVTSDLGLDIKYKENGG